MSFLFLFLRIQSSSCCHTILIQPHVLVEHRELFFLCIIVFVMLSIRHTISPLEGRCNAVHWVGPEEAMRNMHLRPGFPISTAARQTWYCFVLGLLQNGKRYFAVARAVNDGHAFAFDYMEPRAPKKGDMFAEGYVDRLRRFNFFFYFVLRMYDSLYS